VVMTALAKNFKDRFGSIQAFATALEQASLAVQDGPSVQLNEMAPSTPQRAATVPGPLIQHAQESSQIELDQEQLLLKASELLRENGEAHVEVPPQVHADSPSHHTDEQETVPPSHEEVYTAPSSAIAPPTGESASLDALAAHSERSLSSTHSPVSSHSTSAESPQSEAGAYDALNAGRSGTERSTAKTSDESVKPWGLGKRQLIAMGIGIVIYSIVDYLIDKSLVANYHGDYTLWNPLFSGGLYMSWATILYGLVVVVPLLFATKFGPWVGLACIVLGSLIADSFSQAMTDIGIPWYQYAGLALLGFLSGLAFLRTQGVYNTRRNLAIAIVKSIIGLVVYALFSMIGDMIRYQSSWFDSFKYTLASVLVASIGALILLPVLLLIYNNIERRNIHTG